MRTVAPGAWLRAAYLARNVQLTVNPARVRETGDHAWCRWFGVDLLLVVASTWVTQRILPNIKNPSTARLKTLSLLG